MGFESVLINNQRNGTRETWKMPTNFRKEGTHSVILAENCTRELSPLVQIFLKIMLHTITADNTIVNWAALVRDMLFNLGFGYAWMQHGVANRTFFISLFKQRLRDQYIQQWLTSVSTRSSCSIYKNIINHFRCQN